MPVVLESSRLTSDKTSRRPSSSRDHETESHTDFHYSSFILKVTSFPSSKTPISSLGDRGRRCPRPPSYEEEETSNVPGIEVEHDDGVQVSRLRNDLEFSSVQFGGTIICDRLGRIIEVDRHLLEPFGYTSEQEIHRKTIRVLLPDYDIDRVISILPMKHGQNGSDGNVVAITKCTARNSQYSRRRVEVMSRIYDNGLYVLLLLQPIREFDRVAERIPRGLFLRCSAFGIIRDAASSHDEHHEDEQKSIKDYGLVFLGIPSMHLINTSLMSYFHEDDVSRLCHALNYAQKYSPTSLHARLFNLKENHYLHFAIDVSWETGEVICFIGIPEFDRDQGDPPLWKRTLSDSSLSLLGIDDESLAHLKNSGEFLIEDHSDSLKTRRMSISECQSASFWKSSYLKHLERQERFNVSFPRIEEVDLSTRSHEEEGLQKLMTTLYEKMSRFYSFCAAPLSRFFTSHSSTTSSSDPQSSSPPSSQSIIATTSIVSS